jgi:hypothetical protein
MNSTKDLFMRFPATVRTAGRSATVAKLLPLFFLLLFPAFVHAQFTYSTANGAITITGYTGPGGTVAIPSSIGGLPVTAIGTNAFFGNPDTTSVTIPSSVTNIQDSAFYNCTTLTNITFLGNGLTTIGDYAFAETALASFTLPSTITSMGQYVFDYCSSLASFSIPNGVTVIGPHAFYDCFKLGGLEIPASVANIGTDAFDSCYALTSISVDPANSVYSSMNGVLFNKGLTTLIQYPPGYPATNYAIPDTVTTIGDYAFYECNSLTNVTFLGNGITAIGDYAFGYTPLITFTLPSTVTNMGQYVFEDCNSLISVNIPNGLTIIGPYAFYNCFELGGLEIPASVANIGTNAFAGCSSLTGINVDPANSAYTSMSGILFNYAMTTLIQYPPNSPATSYTIPDTVADIGDWAFQASFSLTNVIVPSSVVRIGNYAFYSSGVSTITLPEDPVTSIGAYAFSGSALTSFRWPRTVPYISDFAFNECQSLSYVQIPWGITSIGEESFAFCPALTNVCIPGSVFNIGFLAFYESGLTCLRIGYGVTSIQYDAFYGCPLSYVTIPGSVISMGVASFGGCPNLTGVYFGGSPPDGVGNAFYGDSSALILCYPPGATGWGPTVTSFQTASWNPQIRTRDSSFGMHGNVFGFTVTGNNNLPVSVEATTRLASPWWHPVSTFSLNNGSYYFSDTNAYKYPYRFYRMRFPTF